VEGIAMKKAVGWIVLILLIFYIGTSPGPAADVARSLGDALAEAFRGIGTFFQNLAN
jgi:glycerol uptake facilitator-like aquaporin